MIDSSPEIVLLPTNPEKDLMQMPRITSLRAPAPKLVGL